MGSSSGASIPLRARQANVRGASSTWPAVLGEHTQPPDRRQPAEASSRLPVGPAVVAGSMSARRRHSETAATPLEEDRVAPHAGELSDAFAAADDPEAGALVDGQAGGVLGEDAGLDGPQAGLFGAGR